jgi:Domain of unknown function (DUF5666)
LTPNTIFLDGTIAELANDRRVRVAGIAGADSFEAKEVRFLDSANASNVLLAGAIGNSGASTFYLNNKPIKYDIATVFTGGETGSSADLVSAAGKQAIVRARQAGDNLLALSVEIKQGLDASNSVIGYISDFASLANFRVEGQLVNAEGAVVVGPLPNNMLGNGVFVLVQGQMDAGVLRATRLEVLRN